MTATAKKLYYSVSEYRQGDYNHLTINIAKKEDSVCIDPDYYPFWNAIKITFQSNHNDTPVRWYAGTLEIDGGSNLDKYQETLKLARRACPSGNLDDLDEILSTLARVADYVISDPRTSTAVTALYPPEYECYLDDYEKAGYSSCYVNVLARDLEDAQRAIMRKFAEKYSHSSDFETWILAGKPVKQAYRYYRSEPDYRTIDERVNRTDPTECTYMREWNSRKYRQAQEAAPATVETLTA